MCYQALWFDDNSLLSLPNINDSCVAALARIRVTCLPEALHADPSAIENVLRKCELETAQISQTLNILEHMPVIDVEWELCNNVLEVDQDSFINVSLTRRSPRSPKAHSPRFPKEVDESWFVVLGEVLEDGDGEVIAMKRVSFGTQTTCKLLFQAPETPGMHTWTLYLMCQTYIGLDQEYDVDFMVNQGAEKPNEGGNDDVKDMDY
eukprot:c13843_g1_i2.p1 GENE.c13843_g1_i2~~c13843_g1_i2.p1  ORF type:complete len:206 (+),score=60.13 c13843_g1_i2:215-832(+)